MRWWWLAEALAGVAGEIETAPFAPVASGLEANRAQLVGGSGAEEGDPAAPPPAGVTASRLRRTAFGGTSGNTTAAERGEWA